MTRKRIVLLAAGIAVLIVIAFAGWQGARALWAWRGIERIEFDTAEARARLVLPTAPSSDNPVEASVAVPTPTYQLVEYDAVLGIGSDERSDERNRLAVESGRPRQERAYADAILLWLDPTDGGDPALVSIPRDLVVIDPCTREPTKLDRTLAGCDDKVSGPELVALAVEDYTGISVDHFAAFGFESFIEVIDALGGVEVCVDHAQRHADRDGTRDVLPAGCSTVDGETALVWVRSRTMQELVDGERQYADGVSDQTRSQRQQQLMLAMLSQIAGMRSPAALAGIAESVGDSVILSESLSMGDAAAMAWALRSRQPSTIRRIVVPTESVVMDDGSFALRALVPFRELLEN